MQTANRLAWLRQFRVGVMSGIPFLQAAGSDAGAEDAGEEVTQEEEEKFAQMVTFLGRLFPFVKPSEEFRAQLQQALLAEHRRRLAQGASVPAPREAGISWRWSLAATVPLLIGVLATILWRRSHRADGRLASPVGGP